LAELIIDGMVRAIDLAPFDPGRLPPLESAASDCLGQTIGEADAMKFGIGQPVTRKEDPRFLTGRARYVADIDLSRQAYAVFLFSPHPHARIRSIDTIAAERAPGVHAVLTGQDWAADGLGTLDPEFMPEDMGGPKGHRTKRPPLAIDHVRYVGYRQVSSPRPMT
jgi:CO/xanthine dehydrogenase Mo-binding subunit